MGTGIKRPLTRLEQMAKITSEVEDVDPKQVDKVLKLLSPLKPDADCQDCRELIAHMITGIGWCAAEDADQRMTTNGDAKKAARVLEAAIKRLENATKPFAAHLDEGGRLTVGQFFALSHGLEIDDDVMNKLAELKCKAATIGRAKSAATGRSADYKRYAARIADKLIDIYSARSLAEWSRKDWVKLAHAVLGEEHPAKRSGMEKHFRTGA